MEFEQQVPQQESTQGGESIWDLFWYVIKWVFFLVLIYMGMKYFYDMNKKKQAANLAAEQENDEEEKSEKEENNED